MKELINAIIPKRWLKFLNALPQLWLHAQREWGWLMTVLAATLLFSWSFWLNIIVFMPDTWKFWWQVLILLTTSSALSMIFYYRKVIKIEVQIAPFNYAVLELVTINDKEYFDTNAETHKAVERQKELLIRLSKSVPPYSLALCSPLLINMPRHYYLFRSISMLKQDLVAQMTSARIFMVLVPIKDAGSTQIDFEILKTADMTRADEMTANFRDAFAVPLPAGIAIDKYVAAVSRVFFAICGQSVADMLIHFEKIDVGHEVNDACEVEFKKGMAEVEQLLGTNVSLAFKTLKTSFLCQFVRYTGLLFLNQQQYMASVKHLFKAIAINPYYPYCSYPDYKVAFIHRYAAGVSSRMPEILNELDQDSTSSSSPDWYFNKAATLLQNDEYPYTELYEDIFKNVIKDAQSADLNLHIAQVLNTAFCEEPGRKLIKAEVLKYLPKGDKMHDAVYVDRLPEVIEALEAALEREPDFALLHSRIGSLQLIYAMYLDDPKERETWIKSSFQNYQTGSEYLYRLGFLTN